MLYLEKCRHQDVTTTIHRHVQRVQDAVTVQVCQVVHAIIQGLVGVVFLLVLSWKLSLVALAISPVVALLMLVQSTVVQSYSRRVVDALEGVSASALEMCSSIRLVRSFAKESAEKARFGSQVLSAYRLARHMALANGVAEGVGVLVLKWCLVLSIFYGASLVHHNDISGGILVSYTLIALQVVMALTILPPVIADMRSCSSPCLWSLLPHLLLLSSFLSHVPSRSLCPPRCLHESVPTCFLCLGSALLKRSHGTTQQQQQH